MATTRTTTGGREALREGRIGSAARIRGRVQGDGDLVVEGHIEGNVTLRGNLTIAEGGRIEAESVAAHAVVVAGTLQGTLNASGPVRLAASGRMRGDVQGGALALDEGARFSGKVDCDFELPPELGGPASGEARGRASARR